MLYTLGMAPIFASNTDAFARQMILPEIGAAGQARLAAAKILVVGAGGLGCPALHYLAAAGIGHLGIIDPDRVHVSNLHRQILFTPGDIGQLKAEAAAAHVRAAQPSITVHAYPMALAPDNIDTLFNFYDVILDGTDNFATKYLINTASLRYSKPWVYGAAHAFGGQASVFHHAGGPCYRCLYPDPPTEHIPTCAEAGILGPVAGLVGVTQALQVLAIILDHANFKTLSGRLWCLDAATFETRTLALDKNPDCPGCSVHAVDDMNSKKDPYKETHPMTSSNNSCALPTSGPSSVPEISSADLRAKISSQKKILIVDVREEDEWANGHMPEAQNWPLSRMKNGELPALPKDAEIILHCQKGKRSLAAGEIMQAAGFKNVISLHGGYSAWLDY